MRRVIGAAGFAFMLATQVVSAEVIRQQHVEPRMHYVFGGEDGFRELIDAFDTTVESLRGPHGRRVIRVNQHIVAPAVLSEDAVRGELLRTFGEDRVERFMMTFAWNRNRACYSYRMLEADDAQTALIVIDASRPREDIRSCVVGSAEIMMRFLGGGQP